MAFIVVIMIGFIGGIMLCSKSTDIQEFSSKMIDKVKELINNIRKDE